MDATEKDAIISTIISRVKKNKLVDCELDFDILESKIKANKDVMEALIYMEESQGEPNLVKYDSENDKYTFMDTSKESPKGRRSLCYDQKALEERKKFKPESSALSECDKYGIEILDIEEYAFLQTLGQFDLKTSSWLKTPDKIRQLGGAIFGDRRYDTIFTYHNGADSYYSARGFRGKISF